MPHNAHILIVETDDLIRQLLELWLGEAGYRVDARALHQCISCTEPVPDLVIVNVSDPREAEPLMRTLQSRHSAPLLVISARFRRGLNRSEEVARRIGACRALPKPFTRDELLAAVTEAIGASPG